MIEPFIREVLAEDVGRGDLYARVSDPVSASAKIIAKSDGVLAGEEYLRVLAHIEGFVIVWHKQDGERFIKGDVLMELEGDSHTLLRIERTLLNILLHASSIATLTRKYVDLIAPYGTKLLDTRKTRPMLRTFEKYATRIGGATNHRMGLDDALMLKDTHLKTIDNLELFMAQARQKIPFTSKIEIEAEDFEMAKRAMAAGADIVMCDNMSPDQLRDVVEYKERYHSRVLLEASGNISLDTIENYAKTGVDAISTGSLIHQANWIDVSMKMD
ncbi:MAG: carboxylating nicotinate-nucleotide diphosphorylase [Sulfuricurvum sp.]|jgi:nicotinate-nucleotide pyrophosphorylase (carboxylating)|uniref:carboxylating nicotinate-nucleotide diphosphorylase n=1 Tax=Sulfuricurvum sp. TaxID=2025608 RepID=UPI0025EAD121|nr:carboxylating nicotinate-nucleotide diphosphorylase [Sulfuricurvum sp.]MCK9373125.1 carboxylating nicotinate-nucleotide diphosphorylase [Sulfuricurvum sp.]